MSNYTVWIAIITTLRYELHTPLIILSGVKFIFVKAILKQLWIYCFFKLLSDILFMIMS